ncbi:MarR family winged helix-turn-helix transcriptional regulator [Nocardioides flavescens]|nr:MarR family transcriptional regulator [Nocardioides flavescens]
MTDDVPDLDLQRGLEAGFDHERVPTSVALEVLRAVIGESGRVRHAVSRRAGLSESELDALQHLMTMPDGAHLGPADLSRLLHVTSAAATQITDRLVSRGHVEREPDPGDRRRTRLVVTPSGRAEVIGYLMPMFEGLGRWDGEFSAEERAVVHRYLVGVREVLTRVADGQG